MTLISEITLNGVRIDDSFFTYGVPLDDYLPALGPPTRSESPGAPAPYGHRNNVIHFYDNLGLILREHHATCVIDGIDFLLDPLTSIFPTHCQFQGELIVCGLPIVAGTKFSGFAQTCKESFTPYLGSGACLRGKCIDIHLSLVAPSRKRGSKKTVISEVAVGFKGANWLSVVK